LLFVVVVDAAVDVVADDDIFFIMIHVMQLKDLP
jgi:hypothetical protein